MRNRTLLAAAVLAAVSITNTALAGQAPDYAPWNALLQKYYDPARGMDYRSLKANDSPALTRLRAQLSRVDPASLDPKERLAFWINLYNVSVVGIVVDNYPVDSIRDISTDPIVRLNVFKKPLVLFGSDMISLDAIENEKIREGFRDPRIHFAINCAAKSCPPIRREAYVGPRLDAQLDEQVRAFVNGPHGVRVERKGDEATVHVTKIVDWFGGDFDSWGGGKLKFLRKYLDSAKARALDGAGSVDLEYDDYDWSLNQR